MATTTQRDFTDIVAQREELNGYAGVDRDEAIKAIRTALKRRSGKAWSVTGGRGTGWGWIDIDAPPKRRTGHFVENGRDECGRATYELQDTGVAGGSMTPQDLRELMTLMGYDPDSQADWQGISIAANQDYRIEAIARAEGRSPSTFGKPYWD